MGYSWDILQGYEWSNIHYAQWGHHDDILWDGNLTGYMTWPMVPMLLNRGVMFTPIVDMSGLKCGCFIEMVDPKDRHIQKHQMIFFKHTKPAVSEFKSLNNLMKSVTLWQFNIAAENGGFLKWGYPKSPTMAFNAQSWSSMTWMMIWTPRF